jgi:hypothetical protein
MRIWSLHPSILDSKHLVACWSETLQGIGAIKGKHKMHLNHPQLNRFKDLKENMFKGLYTYLHYVYEESLIRGFKFDRNKLDENCIDLNFRMKLSCNQLRFEVEHLRKKLDVKELKLPCDFVMLQNPIFLLKFKYDDNIEKKDLK